jgi:cystathionine beta-lyase
VNTNGVYTIDLADFEQKIVNNHVKLFILCSPHNPVGRVWTKDELKGLFDICKKHNVFVISDEIHHDLVFADNKHIPSFTVGDYDDMMITLTAPSKTFNLAAAQNSIIIIPDETLRQKWDTFVNQIRLASGNGFGYVAAEAAYKDGRAWFEEVKEIIYNNYLYMKDTFAKELPGVVVTPLEGTYLSWVDMRNYLSADEIKDFMQKKCGLAFDYGDWFGGEAFGTFIRVNLATSRENIVKAVSSIIENINK